MSPLEEEHSSREFKGPSDLTNLDRREFFRYLGLFSSMTLLSHCSRKAEKIIPFVQETKEFAVHDFEYYTSVVSSQGFAQGVLIKSFQGRPIKIEGHPEHPYSLGATTAITQSAPYDLFHPERLTSSNQNGKKVSRAEVMQLLKNLTPTFPDGRDLAFFIPETHSPTVLSLIKRIQKKYPASNWICLAPGKNESFTTYDLENSKTLLSFDEDLFMGRADSLVLARTFMEKRSDAIQRNDPSLMNHLLMVESHPTLLGAKADEMKRVSRAEVWNYAVDLLDVLEGRSSKNHLVSKWIPLLKNQGVVAISRELHPDAKALEERLNQLLGSTYAVTFDSSLPETIDLEGMKRKLASSEIQTAFFLGTDPVGHNPEWQNDFKTIKTKMALSLFPSDTTTQSEIRIPLSHWLESWGDLSTPDGIISIQQPLIDPLYPSFSVIEILAILVGEEKSPLEIVKEQHPGNWEELLRKGTGLGTSLVKLKPSAKKKTFSKLPLPRWELLVLPDPFIGFGENADNPLLQEMPMPFYRHTWNNFIILSIKEGNSLGVRTGDFIRIKTSEGNLEGPVLLSELIEERMILTHAGYGKKNGTKISAGRGFNSYPFRNSQVESMTKIRGKRKPALTQEASYLDHKPPVKTEDFPLPRVKEKKSIPLSLYPEHPLPVQETGPQWAMTIDLTTCIGCEACVTACQVENNIPFVGEDQVRKHRILHWLRIDNYIDEGKVLFQPVLCMHCEKAPCEVVCPVNATVHGNGGLNEMVYNRCVGTRYCSNNCPYKVRRFNFKAYSVLREPWNMGLNPDVSVRDRGVMEKCSFCVQRIKFGERNGGEIKTACQAVCPTQAIVFGDLQEKDSLLVKNKNSVRHYDLLEEEGTRPRTSYLKVIRMKS